jgi:lipopolysaccharide export system permease protein
MLALLAVPLSQRLPRQGRFGSLVLALVIYLFYSNAIHAGLILMEQRGVSSGPGLWPVHLLLAVIAVLADAPVAAVVMAIILSRYVIGVC